MKRLLIISFLCIAGYADAQDLQQKLANAFNRLQADSQCSYASLSLTVLDAKTGQQVFAASPNMGLATASTLKTITTVTAFNILGADFQFQTLFGYSGGVSTDGTLNGDVIIKGGGDPTLGSWRYEQTKENYLLSLMTDELKKAGIKHVNGRVIGDESIFDTQSIPDGWIWQDIGNYYGAGTSGLCWRENQFDIKLHTGPAGTPAGILHTVPVMPYLQFKSELINGPAGTGDNSFVYIPDGGKTMYIRGTYAVDQDKKRVSAAVPDAAYDAAFRLEDTLKSLGITVTGGPESAATLVGKGMAVPVITQNLGTILSPPLSKIVYWLNQKSINLYAEQLLKTMALKAGKKPTTANGVIEVKKYWQSKGIDPASMNIYDGSGLSPGDRVTTGTLARILQLAVKESWFPSFYASLPVYNDMKMKSGSINSVLCYAGYQTKNGRELCFSIMVNNYSGATKAIKEKMFRVLDELK